MKKRLLHSALIAGLATSLYAGDDFTAKSTPIEIVDDSGWEFKVSPYLWLSGIDGTVGLGGLPPVAVDADFSDIWNNLDFAGFISFEANKGKWKTFTDFQYVKLGSKATGPLGGSLELDVEQVRLELGLGYEVYSGENTQVTTYVAAMYNYVSNELSLAGNSVDTASQGWVDPAIGVKITHQFSEKWSGKVTGEYGGFGIESDETWQALAMLGYQLNPKWSLIGGYRYQSIDYNKNDFLYDTNTSGPFLGASYKF